MTILRDRKTLYWRYTRTTPLYRHSLGNVGSVGVLDFEQAAASPNYEAGFYSNPFGTGTPVAGWRITPTQLFIFANGLTIKAVAYTAGTRRQIAVRYYGNGIEFLWRDNVNNWQRIWLETKGISAARYLLIPPATAGLTLYSTTISGSYAFGTIDYFLTVLLNGTGTSQQWFRKWVAGQSTGVRGDGVAVTTTGAGTFRILTITFAVASTMLVRMTGQAPSTYRQYLIPFSLGLNPTGDIQNLLPVGTSPEIWAAFSGPAPVHTFYGDIGLTSVPTWTLATNIQFNGSSLALTMSQLSALAALTAINLGGSQLMGGDWGDLPASNVSFYLFDTNVTGDFSTLPAGTTYIVISGSLIWDTLDNFPALASLATLQFGALSTGLNIGISLISGALTDLPLLPALAVLGINGYSNELLITGAFSDLGAVFVGANARNISINFTDSSVLTPDPLPADFLAVTNISLTYNGASQAQVDAIIQQFYDVKLTHVVCVVNLSGNATPSAGAIAQITELVTVYGWSFTYTP